MKVSQLIEQLKKYPTDMNVGIFEYGSVVLIKDVKIDSDGFYDRFENKWKDENVLVIQ